jgi:hypothetical protein
MTAEPRPPLQRVRVAPSHTVDDYAAVAHLAPAVAELNLEAQGVVPKLAGRTVWMVNSTAKGGGVAEMLPTVCRCSAAWECRSNGWSSAATIPGSSSSPSGSTT